MITADYARLRALAEAATPGAWTADFLEVWSPDDPIPVVRTPGLPVYQGIADAAYIAAADPPTMLALLDRLAELEGREPEWEYALQADGDDEPWSDWYESRELLADNLDALAARDDEHLVRRRKAGPWEPVEGDDDA